MSDLDHITGRQIAAARVLAGIPQTVLAERARVSIATLRRMEAMNGPVQGLINNVLAIKSALEDSGITFIENGVTYIDPQQSLFSSDNFA